MKLKIDNEYWIKDDAVLPSNFDSMKDDEKWNYIWSNNLIHRLDGPAIIWHNGSYSQISITCSKSTFNNNCYVYAYPIF